MAQDPAVTLVMRPQRHVYYDIATEKPTLALRNVEKAQELERDTVPVLALVTTRLLEAYLRSYLSDHKSAVLALREALSAQHAKESESLRQYQDPDWFYRALTIVLYNLAAESFSLHLRSEAIHYIGKAGQVMSQHDVCEVGVKRRITAFKEELVPEMGVEVQPTVGNEETKLPFLPGGQIAASDPGKLVELAQESPRAVSRNRRDSQKLPKIRSLNRKGSKENPYMSGKEKPRYGSVQPSLKRKNVG